MRRAALITGLAGLAVVALTWAAIATARDLPATLPRHLLLYVAAGLTWAAASIVVARVPTSRAQLVIVALVALALRVPAWLTPPAHSDDVHRYLWDGRVERAGTNPYRFAPDAVELTALRDDNWARVNNRALPTIYPPLAEAAFAAAPSLAAWKLLVALADAAVAILLYVGLADRRRIVLWAWSPLVVMELGLNGHVDALGVALLVGALLAWQRRREGTAGALVAAAAAVKLLPVVALLGMRRRRTILFAAIVAVAVALPYAAAGPRMAGSLGEYSRRWRVNDGAFALLYAGAERLVAHTRFARRYEMADSPRLARLVTGRDRDQIFPDEVASFIARVWAGLIFLAVVAWALWRRASTVRIVEAAIGAFVLLTPALHPWYVVWLLPLVAVGGSPAWVVLALLAPLGYRPLDVWLSGGPWRDPTWTRLLEHGLTLVALAIDRWQTSGIIVKFGESEPRGSGWAQGG
jgi:alpha-1,6-mannosyltransferase